MDGDFGIFIFGVVFGGIVVGSISNMTHPDYEDFTKEHNKTPYCIEREVGHEKIKKCYIAKEVE